jgi:hypothetical protein
MADTTGYGSRTSTDPLEVTRHPLVASTRELADELRPAHGPGARNQR